MAQNHTAHGASAGAASDAPLHSNSVLSEVEGPQGAAAQAAEAEDEHAFASEAEEDAYCAGVADGIRNSGGKVPPRLAAHAAKQRLLVQIHDHAEPAPPPPPPGDALAFEPAQLRQRADGRTPQRQREFVEALADCGIVRQAAAKVEMTEQSVTRLRRRADARGFDRACTAAQRLGARRLLSIAYERAIEGTVKRHYFHGELKAEERVYDNRLLIALVNKLPDLHAPDPEADAVAANWEPWMDAIEQGLPSPPPPEADLEPFDAQVWEDSGDLLTDAPPPADFDDLQEGEPGIGYYQRRLTAAEEAYWHETGEAEAFPEYYGGGESHRLGRSTFFPWGSEPSEPSAAAAEPQEERSEASEACGESRPGPDGGAAAQADEPDRRHGFAGTAQAAEPEAERSGASEASGKSRPGPDGGAAAQADEPDRRHGFAGTASADDSPQGRPPADPTIRCNRGRTRRKPR